MQRAALSSGVLLRHFFNGIFHASTDQRFVSRYLVELWCTGNPTAHTLLRHMFPSGMLVFLDMPKLSAPEREGLETMEVSKLRAELGAADDDGISAHDPLAGGKGPASGAGDITGPLGSGGVTAARAAKSGLAGRLRKRLEAADFASRNKVVRRLAAIKESEMTTGKRFMSIFNGPSKEERAAEERQTMKAAEAAVQAERELALSKLGGDGQHENYTTLFFQISQDHAIADLLWSAEQRAELRASLEAELKQVDEEIVQGGIVSLDDGAEGNVTNNKQGASGEAEGAASGAGSGASESKGGEGDADAEEGGSSTAIVGRYRLAWNWNEFEVDYPSLAQELRVGDQYLRVFLEGGTSAVAALRDPSNFFDALYRRVLRETAPPLRSMCLLGMERVYSHHWKAIGPFEDTDYMVWLLSNEDHATVRDHLLQLVASLSTHPVNCEKLINQDCMELIVDLLTTAHTTDVDQRVMPVLGSGGKGGGLMLLGDADRDFAEQEQERRNHEGAAGGAAPSGGGDEAGGGDSSGPT